MFITFLGSLVWLFLIIMICHSVLFNQIEKRKKWFWISLGALLCGLLTAYIGNRFNIYQIDIIANKFVLFFVGWCFGLATEKIYFELQNISDETKWAFKKYYMIRQIVIGTLWWILYFYLGTTGKSILLTLLLWGILCGAIVYFGTKTSLYKQISVVKKSIGCEMRKKTFEADTELKMQYEMQRKKLEKQLKELDEKNILKTISSCLMESVRFVQWLCGYVFGIIIICAEYYVTRKAILKRYQTKKAVLRDYISTQLRYHRNLPNYFRTREEINIAREKRFFEYLRHILYSVAMWGTILFLIILTPETKPLPIGIPYNKCFELIMIIIVGTVFFSWLWKRYGNKTKNVGIDVPVWHWRYIFTRIQLTNSLWSLGTAIVMILTFFVFFSLNGIPDYVSKTAQYSPIVRNINMTNDYILNVLFSDLKQENNDYFLPQNHEQYFIK